MYRHLAIRTLILLLFSSFCTACVNTHIETQEATEAIAEYSPLPTPPSTMPELISALHSDDSGVRLTAARALASMGIDAEPAIPALTENLYYDGPYRVRRAAALALGEIGEPSKPVVPVLITVLLTDFVRVQSSAAWALGEIGDTVAIPALASALQDDDVGTRIAAAEALGLLTDQEFPDMGSGVYVLNEEGEALLVIAAREWWGEVGQTQAWGFD